MDRFGARPFFYLTCAKAGYSYIDHPAGDAQSRFDPEFWQSMKEYEAVPRHEICAEALLEENRDAFQRARELVAKLKAVAQRESSLLDGDLHPGDGPLLSREHGA